MDILQDMRPISKLVFGPDIPPITLDLGGVCGIFVCGVPGEMALTPWFEAIGENGKILRRVNASYVAQVIYV